MFILGIVISVITFPGVIIHELSHKLFCNFTNVKVLGVCYFRFANPVGYVIHEQPNTFRQSFFITIGPFILGTVVSLAFFVISKVFPHKSALGYILIWIGGSIAMHSFPSSGDAKNLWRETNRHIKKSFLAVIGYPAVLLIFVASFLSMFWFDLWYAVILYILVNPKAFD